MDNIAYGYCHCGCGEQTNIAIRTDRANGLIKGEPKRFVRGHQSRTSPIEYSVDNKTDCWVWQRSASGDGYGQIVVGGKHYKAHRYYYEKLRGPIPDGLILHHLCHNPLCVNPDHLQPMTQGHHITNVHCIQGKGGPRDRTRRWQEIRRLFAEGMTKKAIARKVGVTPKAVRYVLNKSL